MSTLLKCFACGEIRSVRGERSRCACGRSVVKVHGSIVELQGPGRVLVPAEDVMTVDGLPWMEMPEAPIVVRRAAP